MDTFEITLDIENVVVENVKINKKGEFIITVVSTIEYAHCHKCSRKITKPYGHGRWITLRHLSILGKKCYIRIRPSRFQCVYCKDNTTTTQDSLWYNLRSPHTKAFEEYILLQLVNSTISDVSIKEDLSYEAVSGIINRYIDKEVNWDGIEKIDVIGLDEISLKKGHKNFVTIVTACIDNKIIILGVLKDRKKETVKKFLSSIPKRLRKNIKTVCSDMYEGYINAAKEVFGKKCDIVVDRFHVAKLYRKGLDGLRKREMKRLKKELSKEDYKKLKGTMWILRKDKKELSKDELEVLECLFKHSSILKLAYELCTELTDIFEKNISKSQAKHEINKWMKKVRKSGINCYNNFLSTLEKWYGEITNYFIDRQTSGFVEGFNNKIKVIKRRCYGIFNVGHLFQRISLDIEGYSSFA